MISRVRLNCRGLLAGLLVLALTIPAGAAPAGQPIRIGSTLALTGPLGPTALLHKIAGEVYVEELNKVNGLLGRPVEWIVLDDQSKPEVTRSLYEKLITVDKVDLLMGPYATAPSWPRWASPSATRGSFIHHSFGMPHLAKYEMHFPTAAFGPEPNKTVPTTVFDGLATAANPPKTVAILTSKFPSAQFQSSGAKEVAEKRGLKVVALPRVRVRHARLGGAWPPASRTQSPISSGSARSASTATSSWRR